MKICVIGAGYVGLTTAACFAQIGHSVTCVDKEQEKIEKLSNKIVSFYEPQLDRLIGDSMDQKKISFSTDIRGSVLGADVIFIAVGTPQRKDGRADLTAVKNVALEIRRALGKTKTYKIVVVKSTVPPGFSDEVKKIIKNPKVDTVSNPEFLREGSAVYDTLFPNRVVIGAANRRAAEIMRELYAPIVNQTFPTDIDPRPAAYVPLVETDIESAEMIKYASNAFLATKISFINEIAHLCELLGADITKITEGMGLDKRIGPQFLQAGLGYGGSCFPKDTQALNQVAGDHGHDFKLLKAVIEVNNLQRKRFLEKIRKGLKNLKGKTIGVLGLSFKPHTDDLREAPSIDIIGWLIARKAAVKVYDPKAMKNTKAVFEDKIKYCNNPYETARDSDALIIATEWQEFIELDLARIKSLMKGRIIFDGRNIYDPDKAKELGFRYLGIGR